MATTHQVLVTITTAMDVSQDVAQEYVRATLAERFRGVEVSNPAEPAWIDLDPDVERAATALGAAAEAARRWDHASIEAAVHTELSAERVAAKVALLEDALRQARPDRPLVAVISDRPFRSGKPHRFEVRLRRRDVFDTFEVPADITHLDGAIAWVRATYPEATIVHTPPEV